MKYLLLLLVAFGSVAEDYNAVSIRHTTGDIGHLKTKDDFGIQFDFRKEAGLFFAKGNGYISKSNLSDTHGFNLGAGIKYKALSASFNYFGETNWEKGLMKSGDCHACTKHFINANWRQHNYLKLSLNDNKVKTSIEYRFIKKEKIIVDDYFAIGVSCDFKLLGKDSFAKAHHGASITTLNVGFKY